MDDVILRAQQYVDAHIGDSLTADALAAEAGVGKWAFIARFRREVGVPPHRYVLQRRLARARDLLAEGEPCGVVAHAVGFFDQSHFTRTFRQAFGASPSRWRLERWPTLNMRQSG